jgi:CheY-like chemotaxis protein
MNGIEFFKRLLGNHAPEGVPHGRTLQAAAGTRMLVVDDSPTIRAVLGKMLGQEGYAVQKAVDGESALELAKTDQPDMIFLRNLRHDPLTRHIPIVMISGNQQATEQFYVQRFGADDFIKKPFGLRELQQSIHRLVQAGRLPARIPAPVLSETAVSPYKSLSDTVSGMAA